METVEDAERRIKSLNQSVMEGRHITVEKSRRGCPKTPTPGSHHGQGIKTMKKGENAVFTIPPDLAYGESGSPPTIPPHATLQLNVELLGRTIVEDICKDGGIVKKILKEGEKWENAKDPDEVFVKYEARLEDGTVVSKSEGVEFTVKDGYFCPALAKAIKTMKKAEKALLTVKPQYGFGEKGRPTAGEEGAVPPNATLLVDLELVSWKIVTEIGDDKKILKKKLKEGEGYECPNEGAVVRVKITGKLQDGTVFLKRGHDEEEPFEFKINEEEVIVGLDHAVLNMKKGEVALVTIPPEYAFGSTESKLDLAVVPPNSTVIYEVELVKFLKGEESWCLNQAEKIEAAFGQPYTPTLFAPMSSPFGRPAISFGASPTPAFGTASSNFGSGSLFGQRPSFGGFGSSPSQSSPFGSMSQQTQPTFVSSAFGATMAIGTKTTPVFDTETTMSFGTTTTPTFGTTAFGVSSTLGSGASSTPSLGASRSSFSFGCPPSCAHSAGAIGSTPFGTPSSPFGAQTSPFGSQTAAPKFGQAPSGNQTGGARIQPYAQTADVDSATSGTQPAEKLDSITGMGLYKGKSHEELRWEDYHRGDKGGPNPSGSPVAMPALNVHRGQPMPAPQPRDPPPWGHASNLPPGSIYREIDLADEEMVDCLKNWIEIKGFQDPLIPVIDINSFDPDGLPALFFAQLKPLKNKTEVLKFKRTTPSGVWRHSYDMKSVVCRKILYLFKWTRANKDARSYRMHEYSLLDGPKDRVLCHIVLGKRKMCIEPLLSPDPRTPQSLLSPALPASQPPPRENDTIFQLIQEFIGDDMPISSSLLREINASEPYFALLQILVRKDEKYCQKAEELEMVIKDLRELTEVQAKQCSKLSLGYQKVCEENRRLYNQLQELQGNIRVYCRVRPGREDNKGIEIQDRTVTVTCKKDGKVVKKPFTFQEVFNQYATQEEVFADMKPLVRSVLDGYNICIIAYGQTGSGKTYTMNGPEVMTLEGRGVNFRALDDLFDIKAQRNDVWCYKIHIQMIEVYNEQVRDLLQSGENRNLEIRSASYPAVPDALMIEVTSTDEVAEFINLGQKNRAVGSTALNDRSSRSHTCLTVHVRGQELTSDTTLSACMHLVDLAGSDRVAKSGVEGERLKEAQNINKSLSALGDVISSLVQKAPHIPYRNSKLTQILKDSLGGHAKTLLFVHIAPEEEFIEETMSTLIFAEKSAAVELGETNSNKSALRTRTTLQKLQPRFTRPERKDALRQDWNKTAVRPIRSFHTVQARQVHSEKKLNDAQTVEKFSRREGRKQTGSGFGIRSQGIAEDINLALSSWTGILASSLEALEMPELGE